MSLKLSDAVRDQDRLAPGHRACLGCAEPTIVRQILHGIEGPVVVASPTGCLEIITTPFPTTAWRVPWIHVAFENVASVLSGVETAYRILRKKGKIEDRDITFVAFAGDGATYDIGLQFLSGAAERGHKFVYVCLNNEAYMNTGIQRSSATPIGAWTTTSPVGKAVPGKTQHRKDITGIMVAHNIPYVAQAAPHAWRDLMMKAKKAAKADGPAFINVLTPCARGWRYEPGDTMQISRLATETYLWPLFEVENGKWRVNAFPEKKPVTEWLKSQRRFAHLLRPENSGLLAEFQERVDHDWAELLKRAGLPSPEADAAQAASAASR
jgi:pyruvate ferredoxin oxidoreductase beta subunit